MLSSHVHKPGRRRWRFFLRGESAIASTGIAAAAILLVGMSVLAWWNARDQRQSIITVRRDEVQSVGILIAQSAEGMLAADELSAIRRIISDAAANHELTRCRLYNG